MCLFLVAVNSNKLSRNGRNGVHGCCNMTQVLRNVQSNDIKNGGFSEIQALNFMHVIDCHLERNSNDFSAMIRNVQQQGICSVL